MTHSMEIRVDDLRGPEIAALVREHMRNMLQNSPPSSVHALPLDALRASCQPAARYVIAFAATPPRN